MLSGGTDGLYRAMLAGPHKPTARIEVWSQGVRLDEFGDEGVPFFSGGISATLNSQVTRQLSFTCSESLWPVDDDGLLAPYGNEIYVFQGVRSGSTIPYEWQTFRGRINRARLSETGPLEINCVDRAGDVNDAGFLVPQNSTTTLSLISQFKLLVTDGVPDATFGTFDAIQGMTPVLSWESDRGGACDDLAEAGSALWYALANGDYVMRFVPWTVPQTALLTLSDGAGGSLFTAAPERSRDEVFNTVTSSGERTDGTAPVFAFAADNDPTSPTFVGGKFGIKSTRLSVPAAQTQDQAQLAANTALRQASSLTVSWQLTMPGDPSMELGDTFIINARNLPLDTQVVESFSLPLLAGPMSVSLRALQPNLSEG
jgi:Domain of unknown function (DUF5047)